MHPLTAASSRRDTLSFLSTSSKFWLDNSAVMETGQATAAAAGLRVQDFDGASDCSRFSLITPPSLPAASSCGECCPQDKVQEKDSDVSLAENDHERTEDKSRLATESPRPESKAPEPCVHSLIEESEYLYSKLDKIEDALKLFRTKLFEKDAALKFENEKSRAVREKKEDPEEVSPDLPLLPNPELYGMPPEDPFQAYFKDLGPYPAPDKSSGYWSGRRFSKTEVRWWIQTALSLSRILCMIVIIVAVFRAPGLLGEMLDVMDSRDKDRCVGFRIRG